MKLFFYDLETTGTTERHAVHQLSGRIIIDGIVKENFDFKVAPHFGAEIDEEALKVCGVTLEQIQAYPDMAYVFPQLMGMLDRYVDKYDKRDKFYLMGLGEVLGFIVLLICILIAIAIGGVFLW